MAKTVDITVLNIDGQPIAVDSLPSDVQDLVATFNDWNRKEAEVRDELLRYQAAKETLSRQIVLKVKEVQEKESQDTDSTDNVGEVNGTSGSVSEEPTSNDDS